MTSEARRPRRRVRRIAMLAAALGIGVATFVIVVHTPPVRRIALRYAIATVQRQYGIRLEAGRLDYNLALLTVGLSDLRVFAQRADVPFVEARYVGVALPRSVLFGDVAFRAITVTDGHVRIVRRADGTSNLPSSSTTSGDEPPPLRIGDLTLPRLAIEVHDDQRHLDVDVPSAEVRLSSRGGKLALNRLAQIRAGETTTRILQLAGEASFDGRTLSLASLQLRTDEGSLRVDGTLSLIVRRPSLDFVITGTADVERLARWGMSDAELPEGQVAYQAHVFGATDDPAVDLRLRAPRLTFRKLAATDLTATARIDSVQLQVGHVEALVEGGRVGGAGVLPFDAARNGGLKVAWDGLDAARLAAMFRRDLPVIPVGSLAGELELEGPLGNPDQWMVSAALEVRPARAGLGELAIPGNATLRVARGRWHVDAKHSVGGAVPVTVMLDGRSEEGSFARSTLSGVMRVENTDIPLLVGVLHGSGLVETPPGDVPHGTLQADAKVGGTFASPTFQAIGSVNDLVGPQFAVKAVDIELSGRPAEFGFMLAAREVEVAGQPMDEVRSHGQMAGSRLVVDEVVATQRGSSGRLSASGSYDTGGEQFTTDAQITSWQVAPTVERPLSARLEARFTGSGTFSQPHGDATVVMRDVSWQDTIIGDADAKIRLDGQTADVDARVPKLQTAAQAHVGLTAPYDATVDVQTDNLDLARFLRGVETPTTVDGRVSLSARAEGPLERWRDGRATVDVTSLEAKAGELPVRLVEPARVSYAGERLRLDRFEAAAGETRISGAGALSVNRTAVPPLVNEALALTVNGNIGEILRAAEAIGVSTSPLTAGDGSVTLLGRVTGSVEAPVLEGDLELGPASLTINDLPAVSDIRVSAHLEDDWLELRDATAAYQGARMTATGRAPVSLFVPGFTRRADGALSLKAQVTGLSPTTLAGIVDPTTLEQVEGGIDASVELAGPSLDLDALTGEMRLDRLDLRLADLPVSQRVPTRIVVSNGFARIASWEWIGQGATLGVRGQVRLRDRQAALLADGQIDLRMVTPFVRAAGLTTAGRMEPRLSITGPIDNPRIDGDLTLQDGQMRLVEPRVIVSDLGTRVVLTRTSARITALTGSVNGGALTGTGEIEYGPDSPLSARLSAEIQGTALDYPAGLRSELNAMLELDMTGSAPVGSGSRQAGLEGSSYPTGRLAGTVNVVRGAYREPLAVVTGVLTGLRARQLTAPTSSPLLARLAIDLRVLTEEDIIVDNNYARAQIGGDLRVSGTAAAPVLSGRAELREGGRLFVGRNVYTINSGTITFANPVSIDPELNVEATTRVRRDEIVVRLNGTAQTLMPELSSPTSPELGQADLTSLLLTGRRIDELAPDDAAFIGEQVIGNLSGEVLGFAGRAIGLDSVRLGGVDDAARRDPTAIATEVDPTSRLTFNKSLRPDVDVTFSQSLRKSDAQTWIVDYLPSRQIQIRLVSDDEDLRSYGFRHDVAFGGGNRVGAATVQPARLASRISEVIVRGELAFPESRLRQVLRLQPGDRFDFAEWQADRDRLEQFYGQQGRLTARIGATRSDTVNGVVLTYEVTAGPQTRIVVSGAELGRAVIARLERAWAGSVFDDFLIDEAVQIVKEALVGEGYLRSMVTARLLTDSDIRRLDITIDRGTRVTTMTVRLEGPEPQLNAEVEQWLNQQRLTARTPTEPGVVQREVTGHLRARGYLGARVTVGAPLFEGATAIVPLTIEAGPAYVLGQVTFERGDDLSPAALREAVTLTEGAPYDPAALEPARDRLVALYRREGFASPAVNARENAHDGVVDLVFTSDPGPRQFIEEVTVTGNRSVDEDVITRALKLPSGEPLRTNDLLSARRRVFDTGLFRRVDITTEQGGQSPVTVPATGRLPMGVRVTVEEWPALRARYGFRVNEERPPGDIGRRDLAPGFSGDVTRRTLFGRAITLGGAAEYQRRERRARTFVTMPNLLGLPLISSFVAERSHADYAASTLVTDRTGLSWEQRTRIAGNLTLTYAYRFDRDHTFDTKPDLDFPFDITIHIARLTSAVARDTRDDPGDTVRGSLVSSTLEYAPEALGSDIRFVRYVAQAYSFRPWRNIVFASAGRLGLVRPLAGQDLIPTERFFAGGARTVRGVREDGLGRLDFFGSPVGGQAMLVFNQEVRVPLYRWLRGVGFLDAGNVFPKASGLSLSDLAGSLGFGFRVATPIGVLRVDYGRRIWPGPAERSGKWVFGLGQMF